MQQYPDHVEVFGNFDGTRVQNTDFMSIGMRRYPSAFEILTALTCPCSPFTALMKPNDFRRHFS
jgi:hypothetical protein